MLNRTGLLKLVLTMIDAIFELIRLFVARADKSIQATIDRINGQEFVFFTRSENIATLNKVMLYILNNKHTKNKNSYYFRTRGRNSNKYVTRN
jgi:hypothetical protein